MNHFTQNSVNYILNIYIIICKLTKKSVQYMINSNPKSPLWVGENKEINTIKNELTEKHKLNDNNT